MSLQGLLPELLGLITAKLENWTDLASFYGTCKALCAIRKKYPKKGTLYCVKDGKLKWWRGKHSRGECSMIIGYRFRVTYITGGIFVKTFYSDFERWRQYVGSLQVIDIANLQWGVNYIISAVRSLKAVLPTPPRTCGMVRVHLEYFQDWYEELFFENIVQGQEALDEIAFFAKIFRNQGVTE